MEAHKKAFGVTFHLHPQLRVVLCLVGARQRSERFAVLKVLAIGPCFRLVVLEFAFGEGGTQWSIYIYIKINMET